jgi:hypothetical protein
MPPMARMRTVLTVLALVSAATASLSADWSPELAARYLDSRQKDWFAWKTAASADGPCVSCHTGMTYLLARPALRRALNESQPTIYEKGLLDRLRANVGAKPAGALQSVEAIFSAMFLSREDARDTMSAHTRKAFDQLWTLQGAEGPSKGAWRWYAASLDPWENPESVYYGASVAALAIGQAPASYRVEPSVREHVASLTTYLANPPASPRLHDRLALLWASSTLPTVLPEAARNTLLSDVFCEAERRRWMDAGVSRTVDGPRRPATRIGQQRLRHGVHRFRAQSRRRRGLAPRSRSSAHLAAIAPGPGDRCVAGRVHEQALPRRFHGVVVHAGRGDGVRSVSVD